MKLVIAHAADDIDADRQLALAPDHRPIVPSVQVEADLLRFVRAKKAAKVWLRASQGLKRDLHSPSRRGHCGDIGEI